MAGHSTRKMREACAPEESSRRVLTPLTGDQPIGIAARKGGKHEEDEEDRAHEDHGPLLVAESNPREHGCRKRNRRSHHYGLEIVLGCLEEPLEPHGFQDQSSQTRLPDRYDESLLQVSRIPPREIFSSILQSISFGYPRKFMILRI